MFRNFKPGIYVENFAFKMKENNPNLSEREKLILSTIKSFIRNYVEERRIIRDTRTDGKFQWKKWYPYVTSSLRTLEIGEETVIIEPIGKIHLLDFSIEFGYYEEDTANFAISVSDFITHKQTHISFINWY